MHTKLYIIIYQHMRTIICWGGYYWVYHWLYTVCLTRVRKIMWVKHWNKARLHGKRKEASRIAKQSRTSTSKCALGCSIKW